jgi:hypothetical protein
LYFKRRAEARHRASRRPEHTSREQLFHQLGVLEG